MSLISASTDAPGVKTPPCILIAEDNENDAEVLKAALTEALTDIEIKTVSSCAGLQAFFQQAGEEHPFPDPLFLDPKLEDGNCLPLLRGLKNRAPKPMITVVLSGGAEVQNIRSAYEAGADTFLAKPIRSAELVNFLTFRGFIGQSK